MPNYMKLIAIGHLAADPETKQVGDSQVANFRIGVSERFKGRDGQQQERTEWLNCVAWGGLAKVAGEYLRKGAPVMIEGKLVTRSYDKDGEKRYVTDVRLDNLQLLGGKAVVQGAVAPSGAADDESLHF